jgi:protein-disulfide isomerase
MSDPTPSGSTTFVEKYLTPLSILVVGIIIVLALLFGPGAKTAQQAATSGQPKAATVDIKSVKTAGEPTVGATSAPVTMALFFDYQCPFCKQFDQTVVAQIYTNYVQAGKVKIVFKDFDFLGPDSIEASEFARAFAELYPDQFYAFYSAVFAAQGQETRTLDPQYLPGIEKIAAVLPGVDVKKVDALMTQKKAQYDTTIQNDFTEGQGFGIQGTPNVIVGTTLLQGAQTYSTVSALIDAQLKK